MPPVNDNIANATLLTPPSAVAVTTVTATGEVWQGGMLPDVWYRIEPATALLLGISSSKTGGAGFQEIDLYRLIGPDPPTDWAHLEFIDWHGDGTATPADGWEDTGASVRLLEAGEIYFLNCYDYNFVDEVEFDMDLTSASPLVNDNWQDATVIDQVGGNVLQVTNVQATAQAGENTAFGDEDPSVWYRIEAQDDGVISLSVVNTSDYRVEEGYRFRLRVYGPVSPEPTAIADIDAAPVVVHVRDGGPLSNHEPYDDRGGWEPWYSEWLASTGDVFYVRVTNNSVDDDPVEGSFEMRVTIPQWTDFPADVGANLSSPTVSIVDTDWVRDEQYRTIDFPGQETWKGALDYTKTFEVEPGLSGRYAVQLRARFVSATDATDAPFVCVMRVNGNPVRVGYDLYPETNDVVYLEPLTQEYMKTAVSFGADGFDLVYETGAGGPRWVDLSAGDVVSFHCGNLNTHSQFEDETFPDRFIEIQAARFSPAAAYDPLPTWKMSVSQQEKWAADGFSTRVGVTLGNKLWIADDVEIANFPIFVPAVDREYSLNVWEYELIDGRIVSTTDLPLGDVSGPPTDLLLGSRLSEEVLEKSMTILPNGDIYLVWTQDTYLALARWDGSSWTIFDDVTGHGAPYSFAQWRTNHPSIDNDGIDVYITWGENVTMGQFNIGPGNGWHWRCKKFDTSAETFSELGSGQTAWPSATQGVRDGDYNYPTRIRCSPAGVPYVMFASFDPDYVAVGDGWEEFNYLWRWNGSAWVDMGLPHPDASHVPDPVGDPGDESIFAIGTPGDWKGNYTSFISDSFIPRDLVFCHHDGLSETPAIIHQFVFTNQPNPVFTTGPGDMSGWFYSECDGVDDWHNSVYIVEAQEENIPGGANIHGFGRDYPNRFASATSDFDGNTYIPFLGGWTQGMRLDIYNNRPVLFTQKGYFGQGSDCVYAATINAVGDNLELIGQRFPTDTYTADIYGYQWTDVSEPGCIVNGTPVCWWTDASAWDYSSYFIAAFAPAGGNISMNWRSADRRGSANRVLVGTR